MAHRAEGLLLLLLGAIAGIVMRFTGNRES
jgi:hypothetical protein